MNRILASPQAHGENRPQRRRGTEHSSSWDSPLAPLGGRGKTSTKRFPCVSVPLWLREIRGLPSAVLALALLAGCTGPSSPVATTDQDREVQRAFETWRSNVVAGNAEKVYRGMSTMMVSEWLFVRLRDPADPIMAKSRGQLRGAESDDLDVWFISNRRSEGDRPSALPGSVLASPWLFECFTKYFEADREKLKDEFSRLEVANVYTDGSGATVVVRNPKYAGTDRYVMANEGGWKIDRHIEPAPLLPK